MKNLNELAIETFDKLLALPDEEFNKYFESIKPSELSGILEYSGMIELTKDGKDEEKKS